MNPKDQRRQATVGERVDTLGTEMLRLAEAVTERLGKAEAELRRVDAQDLGLTKRLDAEVAAREEALRWQQRHVDDLRTSLYTFRDRGFFGRLRWLVRGL